MFVDIVPFITRRPNLFIINTLRKEGLFISAKFFSMYDAIHGWMMRWMDG
jgi:hypothetical protein